MRQCGTNGRNGYRWTDNDDIMCGYQLTDGGKKKNVLLHIINIRFSVGQMTS